MGLGSHLIIESLSLSRDEFARMSIFESDPSALSLVLLTESEEYFYQFTFIWRKAREG